MVLVNQVIHLRLVLMAPLTKLMNSGQMHLTLQQLLIGHRLMLEQYTQVILQVSPLVFTNTTKDIIQKVKLMGLL